MGLADAGPFDKLLPRAPAVVVEAGLPFALFALVVVVFAPGVELLGFTPGFEAEEEEEDALCEAEAAAVADFNPATLREVIPAPAALALER